MDEIQVAAFRWPGPEAHPTPGKKDRVCRTVVRRLACLSYFILSAVPALTAQSFAERFADRFSVGDTAAARQVLQQWEASAERPAEFFVAGLNYCFHMARQSLIVLGDNPGDGNGPTFETVDSTGTGHVLFLFEAVRYDTALVRRGIAYVDRGIEAYPLRLDMRFGKIRALGEIGDYGRYVDAIVDAVAASADNACRWLWSDDRPLEDGREFMLSAVQDYVNRLYELGTDEGLDGMDRIASTVLGIYPDHVESLDNAAIVRIVRGRYDEAKPLLMRAERLAPRDMTILANLAELHVRQGDRPAAATYYRRMADCAEGSDRDYALRRLRELEEKE